jgi:competence protein ComEA
MKFLLVLLMSFVLLFASVDINTANAKELSSLKGVGEVKAKAIVEYRKHNCFKSVDELLNVKGIGKKTLSKNRDKLSVSECK